MTLKVCLVSPLPPPASGIASWSLGVLQWTRERHDIEITHVDTAVRWRSTNDDSRWKRLIGGTMQALRDTIRVFNAIRKAHSNVIHLCTSGSLGIPKDILILFITKLMGVRSVLHYHRGDLPELVLRHGLAWKLMRQAMLLADVVLLLDKKSEESAKMMLPNIRIERIPNPIDIDMIQNIINQEERGILTDKLSCITFAGWVVPAKGVRELVEACLTITDVPFVLSLVGNVHEALRHELESVAAQRDGGNWLKFHGMLGRLEAIKAIGSADIFVLPSYTEGFPNVVLEAMALSKPVIATRVGAIPEMLGDGLSDPCGIIVSPRNVAELRAAILNLLVNPEEVSNLGKQAKQRVVTLYAIDTVMAQLVGLWHSLK